jgi:hypothetical protein
VRRLNILAKKNTLEFSIKKMLVHVIFPKLQCEHILMDAGASYEQAKNGAYVYLHHGDHLIPKGRTTQDEYDQMLDEFGATKMPPQDCIKMLNEAATRRKSINSVYSFYVSNSGHL